MAAPLRLPVPFMLLPLFLSLAPTPPVEHGVQQSRAYRILVVNDDGIESAGLTALVKELSVVAEVVVCAPEGNRSGSSHSISVLSEPLTVVERNIDGATYACAVSGTPADAANFGILKLGAEKPFDLVVSGINAGSNVGNVAHYSGTIGAAMEAAYRGVPAIAVSQSSRSRDYSLAARFTARFVGELRKHGPAAGIVYSINVPAAIDEAKRSAAPARMGGSYLGVSGYTETKAEDGKAVYRAVVRRNSTAAPDSDTYAFQRGRITITPLRFDWTDEGVLGKLRSWRLELPE